MRLSRLRTDRRRLVIEPLERRQLLSGAPFNDHGLTAQYFDNADLTGSSVTRVDPFVNFDFGIGGPASGILGDTFSARWTGRVQAPYSEAFTFYTRSDDGVRLWINNQQVINNWSNHIEVENASAPVALVAGNWYDLRLEYFDSTARAVIKLLWSSASNPKVVIPSERLQPVSPPAPAGRVLLETYNNIPGGAIGDLTNHASYPTAPSASQYIQSFEAPSNRGDLFGSRVRGYVIAPETGDYTFWIAGDEQAQLYLSNDESAANKRLIASVPAGTTTAPREWDKFAGQRSLPVRLVAGQRYYVEALHKENAGSDHLAVGWELPSGAWERPIPAARLLPVLPEVRLYTHSATTYEGSTSAASFTVARDDDLGRELAVHYYLGGTAINGVDYAARSGVVVIPAGQRSEQIAIAATTDAIAENKETVVVMLATGPDYILGPPSTMTATATITDGLPAAPGTNLLPANPLTTVGFSGGAYATRQIVGVSGMPFTQAIQLRTNAQPPNVWDIQLRWNNTAAIQAGQTLFASFWLRNADASKPEAHVDIVFEMNGSPWTKSASHVATVGNEWTRVDLPFTAAASYAVGGAAFALRFGYTPQTVQIGGLSVVNYGAAVPVSSLPQTQLSYPGQEATADWRAEADARIEQIRKAPLSVLVRDAAGNAVEGALVEITQRRHAYGFGSAIAASPVLNNNSTDGSRYRALVKSLYNKVVTENALKWPNWQSSRQTGINLVNWLVNNGLDVRGHTLVWPSWQYLPTSLKTTYDSKVASEGQTAATAWLRQAVIDHIADEASTLSGKLVEWDVINEPYANHELQDILGNSAMIDWFEQAKQSDPVARMFINDYGILSNRGADYAHQNHYFNTIQYLLAGGAPVEGIGMQSHFGSGLTGMKRMLEILDRFATFGVPIQSTEFDVNVSDEQVQADFLRDFMTTLFSHASTNGIVMWGFWQNAHWLPQAALYRADWTIKPNGQAWVDLVHDLWQTETVGTTLGDGKYSTRGFLGEYEIKVTYGGQTTTVTAELATGGATVNVNLAGTLVGEPRNVTAVGWSPSVVHVRWDAPPSAVDGYRIERQLPGMPWAEIASVPAATLSFSDASLSADALYRYRVRAVRGGALSVYSDAAEARTLPATIEGTSGNDAVHVRTSGDQQYLEVYVNLPLAGAPTYRYRMELFTSLVVNTAEGDDALVVDYSAGNPPPSVRLEFHGGGGANTATVAAGLVSLDADASGTLNTTVQNGAQLATNRFNQNGLTLTGAGSKAIVRPGGALASVLTAFSFGAGTNLDLTDNDLIVLANEQSAGTLYTALRGQITSAQNGLDANFLTRWDGAGLTSSTARATNVATGFDLVGLGLIRNSYLDITTGLPGSTYTSFGGVAVGPHDLLVKHTYIGDGNLDGVVSFDDYVGMDNAFFGLIPNLGWATGDINSDGAINFDDYSVVDQAFFFQGAALASDGEPEALAPGATVWDDVGGTRALAVDYASRTRWDAALFAVFADESHQSDIFRGKLRRPRHL